MRLLLLLLLLSAYALLLVACTGARPAGRQVKPAWTLLVGETQPATAHYQDGLYFVLGTTEEGSTLFALDEATGQTVWQQPAVRYRLTGDALFVGDAAGACARLDARTGTTRETLDQRDLCDPARRSEGTFLYDEAARAVVAREPDGAVLWQTPIMLEDRSLFPQPPGASGLLERDGRVLLHTVGFRDNPTDQYLNVQLFDAQLGALVWQVVGKLGQGVEVADGLALLPYAEPDAEPGVVRLHALDWATGVERWSAPWPNPYNLLVHGGVAYGCAEDGTWRWIELASGEELGAGKVRTGWTCPGTQNNTQMVAGETLVTIQSRPSKGHEFDLGGSPPQDGWVEGYDLRTGKALWHTAIALEGVVPLSAIGDETVLTAWSEGYRAYRLRP